MNRYIRYMCNVLSLQLFVTLISLPIIIAWGLPLSFLTPLGNVLFGPVLLLFLLICAVLFVAELCGLPNGGLIWLLEQISFIWRSCSPSFLDHCLFAFAMPSWWVLVCIPLITFGLLHIRVIHTSERRLGAFMLLTLATCCTLWITGRPAQVVERITGSGGEVVLINAGGRTTVVDTGRLGSKRSAVSWCAYDLAAEILKRTGRVRVDHLISLRPTSYTLEAFAALHSRIPVQRTYLPAWHDALMPNAQLAYQQLQSVAKQNGRQVEHVTDHQQLMGEHLRLWHGKRAIRCCGALADCPALSLSFDSTHVTFYPTTGSSSPRK